MAQDSATSTSTTPPPLSTSDESVPVEEIEPKQVTLEPELPEVIQPPSITSELTSQLPVMVEPKEANHAAEDSVKHHRMTPEKVSSEPEEQNHVEEVDSVKLETETLEPEQSFEPHQVTPEKESSEPEEQNNVAEVDSENPHQVKLETETLESEQVTLQTEQEMKLMLEHQKKYMEVLDWTEPEPPDAAVLEAAALEPEPKKSETQNPEVAAPPAPTTASSVESRSLAAMMNREEAEEKPKTQIPRSLGSFKEETNKISDLSEPELNALHELRSLLQESEDSVKSFIWGVPLLKDERSDIVLLKFLRARDFKPREAYSMLKKTLQWRIDFNIEELLDENLGDDLDKVVFMQGHDKKNHPVCYNVYGEFQNKDLYHKTFSDEEKREKFLRWRIQFLEKSIRKLDFVADGVSTICQVNDLKNSPGPSKTELRLATKQALHLLQDNYPEFVSKQIFINVPWWYLAFYRIISPFLTQRSKSKLVFASPSKSAETLFKYISPEHVPVRYGGLSVDNCHCNSDFTLHDTATEITIKPTTKQTVEIIIYEKCTIVWEMRVIGWDVSYGAEFVPENKEGYTVIIQKPKKMTVKDEPVVTQSFKVAELGKILLSVDNTTSTKKMLIYRFKVKAFAV